MHCVSWVAGGVYVGDGTLGAADNIYFSTADGTGIANQTTSSRTALIPVAGQDGNYGATYVKALFELYRRVRYRSIRVHFVPLQSSTSNNLTLTAAPVRGSPGYGEVVTPVTSGGTSLGTSQAAVMSMTGSKTRDSFEQLDLELTSYCWGIWSKAE
jgi:hypothetical protein